MLVNSKQDIYYYYYYSFYSTIMFFSLTVKAHIAPLNLSFQNKKMIFVLGNITGAYGRI